MKDIFLLSSHNYRTDSKTLIDVDSYNKMIDDLTDNGYVNIPVPDYGCKSDIRSYIDYDRCFTALPNSILVVNATGAKTFDDVTVVKYTLPTRQQSGDEDDCLKGSDCYRMLNENNVLVNKYGKLDKSYKQKLAYHVMVNCCRYLRPMIYLRDENDWAENANKIDVSSAYPSCAYDLPTTEEMQYGVGETEPTDEYPFVFYGNGRVVIKELDGTITDTKSYESEYYHYGSIKTKGEINHFVKMKRSNDNYLYDEFKKLYDRKSIDKEAKQKLNFTIGFMRSEKHNFSSYQGHISAVIYARHLRKMDEYINDLLNNGCEILHVLTDSIIYSGEYCPFDEKKELGKMVLEVKGKMWHCLKSGQYVFINEDGTLDKDTLHTQAYKDEIKPHIKTIYDFDHMKQLAKEIGNVVQYNYNQITHKWEN